ncbi:MAG: hypothetical protein IKL16_00040 [Clostridia bacterium]|nr:hypothetical protein [Clostridia bacterium]
MTTKFKETKIHVSFFFGLTVALMGLFDETGNIFLCLMSGIIHEAGHLAVLLLNHEKPKDIYITPFGMRIERQEENITKPSREILCAFAGPLVNILAWLLFKGSRFSEINLTIGLFNLLPCEPLDGNKILENFLRLKFSEKATEKISLIISCITVVPVAILGFIILFESRYNFSLLFISFYIIFFIALKKKNI